MTFTVTLPLPPSANALYRNVPGKGRRKTGAYRLWQKNAILSIFAQVRADYGIRGAVAVTLLLPIKMRGDIDNRVKATLDALVKSNRIDDDKHVSSIIARRTWPHKDTIMVRVEAA